MGNKFKGQRAKSIEKLPSSAVSAGKPTAAVCHGTAGLVKTLRIEGKSILFGKKNELLHPSRRDRHRADGRGVLPSGDEDAQIGKPATS